MGSLCSYVYMNIQSIVYLCLPVFAAVLAAHIQEYMFIACAGLANVPVHVHCMYMYVYDLGGYLMSMQLHVHVHVHVPNIHVHVHVYVTPS